MTKLVVMPSSLKQINDLLKTSDAFIIGLKDMSVNMPCYFELEEIKQINDLLIKNNKELFISLNKNMHTSDLAYLKEILIELDNLNIKGILYYDISIVNIKQELNLKTDLVWSQEHSTTNYETINYWYQNGVKYTNISTEITINEIIEISKKTKASLMVNILGYMPMFVSKRKLVSNYLKAFKIEDKSSINFLKKEGKTYTLIEDNNSTVLYSNAILNGYNEYLELKNNNIEYAILNSFNIDEDVFNNIVYKIKEDNITEEEIDKILKNTTKGFLYTETVYKVKNYE